MLVDRRETDFCILQNPKCHHKFTDREGMTQKLKEVCLLKHPALERHARMSGYLTDALSCWLSHFSTEEVAGRKPESPLSQKQLLPPSCPCLLAIPLLTLITPALKCSLKQLDSGSSLWSLPSSWGSSYHYVSSPLNLQR